MTSHEKLNGVSRSTHKSTHKSSRSAHKSRRTRMSAAERREQLLDVTLELICERRTNSEIAEMLFISPHTVKGHVSAILIKLGVANRVQAAVYAARHGLD